jgi:hypothetical protein
MHNFTPKGWSHIQLYKNIYKLNNVHKLNKQRHSNNIQIKWKQIQTCHLLFTKYWKSPFWYDTNETISENGIRKHKSTSEIKFCEVQVHSIKKRIHKIIKRAF